MSKVSGTRGRKEGGGSSERSPKCGNVVPQTVNRSGSDKATPNGVRYSSCEEWPTHKPSTSKAKDYDVSPGIDLNFSGIIAIKLPNWDYQG